jgi:hypothetical protein
VLIYRVILHGRTAFDGGLALVDWLELLGLGLERASRSHERRRFVGADGATAGPAEAVHNVQDGVHPQSPLLHFPVLIIPEGDGWQ